jgi:hypothetical protein
MFINKNNASEFLMFVNIVRGYAAKLGYTRRRRTKKNLKICAGHHYTEANTINVNKTCALLLKVKTNRTSLCFSGLFSLSFPFGIL